MPLVSETFALSGSIAAFERAAKGLPPDVKLQIRVAGLGGLTARPYTYHLFGELNRPVSGQAPPAPCTCGVRRSRFSSKTRAQGTQL